MIDNIHYYVQLYSLSALNPFKMQKPALRKVAFPANIHTVALQLQLKTSYSPQDQINEEKNP